jgi:Rieske Fe-S protein
VPDRRTFISQATLAAVAAALCACSGDAPTEPELTGSNTIKVGDYPALATINGVAVTSLAGSPIAVVRTGTTSFLALSRICPHQGGTINIAGSGFRCPRHGATFSRTGTWVSGQQTTNMRSFATSYNATTDLLTITA